MTTTTIQKWGNSYAVRLPKAAVERLNLHEGQAIEITESDTGKGLSLTPAGNTALSLTELCAGITPENRHGEVNWGPSVGKEIW